MNMPRPRPQRGLRRGPAFARPTAVEPRSDWSRGHLAAAAREASLTDPIFILGLPRSFSWWVCAMIGQHPQTLAMPELQLFGAATIDEWWAQASRGFPLSHGLLRAVAQVCFGNQSEDAIDAATGWLTRRSQCTTGIVLEELIERAAPRILVEKSPAVVYRQESMRRMLTMFPTARFIHLVRHPIGHGQAVLDTIAFLSSMEALPPTHWLHELASPRWPQDGPPPADADAGAPDPQSAWFALNDGIREFLAAVPPARRLLLRGEDLLARPQVALRRIAAWAGLRTDSDAIEAMRQPVRSPFACYGPANARYGIDVFLSKEPFRSHDTPVHVSLDAPLPWSRDGLGLRPEVVQLAREFGYD